MAQYPVTSTDGVVGFMLIDDCDKDIVHGRKVNRVGSKGKPYLAVKRGGKRITVHIEIGRRMGFTGQVDHRSRDTFDCRRMNLRACSQAQNRMNSSLSRASKSGFKGVSWYKRSGKWLAQIKYEGKNCNLGYYDDPKEAAHAYDRRALELFGAFATTNAMLGLLPEQAEI